MAAITPKAIKKSIKSIGNTKKITKAMEMVAAVKMRKAVSAVLSSRDYAQTAKLMVLNLIPKVSLDLHPLLRQSRSEKKIAIVLITSNRGLCGGFNNQIINEVIKFAVAWPKTVFDFITLGQKGRDYLLRNGKNVIADFSKPDIVTSAGEITALAKLITDSFLNFNYDKILVAYTDYYSALKQTPRLKQILPLDPSLDFELGQIGPVLAPPVSLKTNFEYLFEPAPAEVLKRFLPHLIEVQLYQALLEANASEHSARMLAMKNASSAAADLINELTLIYNQARQAAITKEIAEISGGKTALEQYNN